MDTMEQGRADLSESPEVASLKDSRPLNPGDPAERRRHLKSQNEALSSQIAALSTELEPIEQSILALQENTAATQQRIRAYPSKIETLKAASESLVAALNRLRLKVKIAREDEESTRLLRKTLLEEYENLKNERLVLVKRIKSMEQSLNEISAQREKKLPKLKRYDEMLREARNVFYDVEGRMAVSMKLKHGRTSCKLPPL